MNKTMKQFKIIFILYRYGLNDGQTEENFRVASLKKSNLSNFTYDDSNES